MAVATLRMTNHHQRPASFHVVDHEVDNHLDAMLGRLECSGTQQEFTRLNWFLLDKWRKRKREKELDSVSVQSLDVSSSGFGSSTARKVKRSMSRVTSLISVLSPSGSRHRKSKTEHPPVQPSDDGFKAPASPVPKPSSSRLSLSGPSSSVAPPAAYRAPRPWSRSGQQKRGSQLWSETVTEATRTTVSREAFKLQEAIYELSQGEDTYLEDLTNLIKCYYEPMKKLRIMPAEDLDRIFGPVEPLIPIHQEFAKALKKLRKSDGITANIGQALVDWVVHLEQYITYCGNQVLAKALLDTKKSDSKVEDFLQRCQESRFSRKLCLWNFLDLPRSRLVKYPLLLKQILKYTPDDCEDKSVLPDIIERVERVLGAVDDRTAESKCELMRSLLDYPYESQEHPLIQQSTRLLCSGEVKNDRGTKLEAILLDKILVVARRATRNGESRLQVVKQPIPLHLIRLGSVEEAAIKKGSFKKALSYSHTVDRCTFPVGFLDRTHGPSQTLVAHDEHDLKKWRQEIEAAASSYKLIAASSAPAVAPSPGALRRRSSTRSCSRSSSSCSTKSTCSSKSGESVAFSLGSTADLTSIDSEVSTIVEKNEPGKDSSISSTRSPVTKRRPLSATSPLIEDVEEEECSNSGKESAVDDTDSGIHSKAPAAPTRLSTTFGSSCIISKTADCPTENVSIPTIVVTQLTSSPSGRGLAHGHCNDNSDGTNENNHVESGSDGDLEAGGVCTRGTPGKLETLIM